MQPQDQNSAPISPDRPSQESAKQPQDTDPGSEPLGASPPVAMRDTKHITLSAKARAVLEGRSALLAMEAGKQTRGLEARETQTQVAMKARRWPRPRRPEPRATRRPNHQTPVRLNPR